MGKNKWIMLLFLGVCFLFFYPIFLGKIPFPGDLLISEYSPWKYFSFLGYAPGGYPEKFQYFDVIRQMYPWTTFVIHSLRTLQFPLWNPYNFSGTPLFANSQSAVLYPLHFLYFLLPQTIAWTILVMLQPFLISIFTYLYVRKIGMGKWGSVLTSIAFGYSLFISVFLQYNTIDQVIIFLPLLLWIAELLFEKKTVWRTVAFVLSIAFSLFAGHIQLFGFVMLFVAAYILFKLFLTKKERIKQGIFFVVVFLLGVGVSLVQLLPTLELIQHAARSSQEYSVLIHNLLLQPYQSILFLSPDIFGNPATKNYLLSDSYPGNAIYIGLIPFVFACLGLFQRRKNRFVSFFAVTSIVLLILFFNTPFTQAFYKLQIPLLSTGSPTNAIFLLSFSLSILAGFGLEQFLLKKEKKNLVIAFGVLILFLLGIGLLRWTHTPFIFKNALYTLGLFVALGILSIEVFFFPRHKRIVASFFILLTILDLFYFSEKFNPFVKPSLVFPQTPITSFLKTNAGNDRFWSYGNAEISSNFATQYGLYDVNGYDPLYPKSYGEFIKSVTDGKMKTGFSDENRSDALLPGAYTAEDLLKNQNELRVLDLLGVKYLVTKDDPKAYLLSKEGFKLVFNQNGWQIYQNNHALPRAFLVFNYESYTSGENFANKFYSSTFNPQKSVLLNTSDIHIEQGTGSAHITTYMANKVVIQTKSNAKALLFLSDEYFPGWKAYIDGKEHVILKADYAFRSVEIPAGIHTVTFVYQPSSFSLGLTLTIISLGFSFLVVFLVNRKKL